MLTIAMPTHKEAIDILRKVVNKRLISSEEQVLVETIDIFDDKVLDRTLEELELSLEDCPRPLKKRIFRTSVEIIQNIYNHGLNLNSDQDFSVLSTDTNITNSKFGFFVLTKISNFVYRILAGNFVNDYQREFLDTYIRFLKDLDRDELKEFYFYVLQRKEVSNKKGGGLGYIEIAKKSKSIAFDFIHYQNNIYIFIFTSVLSIEQKKNDQKLTEMEGLKKLIIEGSNKTPFVKFDAETGILEMRGRSIPENAIEFYKPLVEWLDKYSKIAKDRTEVNIQLEYFNTSSSKCILDIFKKLEEINKKEGKEVIINWYYEEDDEDMLEAGEDYQSILKIPFRMIEMEE